MPPRPIRPKDEPDVAQSSDNPPDPKISRRKAVSSACIPCRKRKSKCDGGMPACSTCTAVYRTECSYDADSDHRRKGALKRDLQSLQVQNDALDVIVASLRSLPENEAVSLLHNLRNETSPEMLAAALRSNVRLPASFAPQTLEADLADEVAKTSSWPALETKSLSSEKRDSTDDTTMSVDEVGQPTTWFPQPQDAEFVDHLLHLYFCWVHPFYHLFSREHFLHDMSRGRTEFCSALLVNAVLAIACHYSDRSLARSDPNDSTTAGDYFFAEAKRLLDKTDKASVTSVQALGLMALRETSQGRESHGYQYAGRCVRTALEMGLHLSMVGSGLRSSEIEVRKITFWGVFNLETICSVGFGRLSQLPIAAADISRPSSDRVETQTWRPYEDNNFAPGSNIEQPLHPMLFTDQLSKLSELASDMVNTFYAPRERFTSRRLALAYKQYQEWHRNLPDAFRLENTSLPHVIILHMYYHACILHLFRPYVKLDLSGANLWPREACTHSANEISSLMNALRAMYGLRRVSLAVTSLLLSAGTIHLLNLPQEPSSTHISQALYDLQAMSVNHNFAGCCVDILRSLSSKWQISLPDSTSSLPRSRQTGSKKGLSPTSSTFWGASIRRGESGRSSGSASSQQSSPFQPSSYNQQQHSTAAPMFTDQPMQLDPGQMQNTVWTPFPGQTMPVLPQQVVPSMAMDIPNMDGISTNWDMFDNTVAGQARHNPMTGGPSGSSHFQDWNWQ
ncbi:uncharacterized protein LTR77_010382 [Saxophila tyrrhenica]|uniref:Zn(2)-C6 fungal-type domain-containing protein n=1 Tax=Saxophila tyrrhenica TaxID=1690608 RepID=A0AAV9NZ90_9PEZI|nr:hypothetical protein LTR77_010382 [Saxophila tyrrhenica]